jgi:hypothetical protein
MRILPGEIGLNTEFHPNESPAQNQTLCPTRVAAGCFGISLDSK